MSVKTRAGLRKVLWHLESCEERWGSDAIDDYDGTKAAALGGSWSECGLGARHRRRVNNRHGGWAEAKEKLWRCLAREGAQVALVGGCGSGKTQLAAFALRYALETTVIAPRVTLSGPPSARYTTARNMFLDIKGTYAHGARSSEGQLLELLSRYRLLVIDDLQIRQHTEWENRVLHSLIDRRYRDMRPTILIANGTPQRLAEDVGEAVVDRMNELGGVIPMDWPSFRHP